MAINFPPNATDPNPPSDGDSFVDDAGTEWVYDSTNNSWTISGNGNTPDDRYVNVTGDNMTGDLTLGNGTDDKITLDATNGVGAFKGGISVPGGSVPSDADDSLFPVIVSRPSEGGGVLFLSPRSADKTASVRFTLNPPQTTNAGGGAVINHTKVLDAGQDSNLKLAGNWSGDYTVAGGSAFAFNAYLLASCSLSGATTTFSKPVAGVGVGCIPYGNDFVAFRARGKSSGADAAASWIGVKSEIKDNDATTGAYNFYADTDAPNFFAGNTYIGGTTARNTFDLWKSTLTEEQLEQFEAGTLVAPANVSLPGDGSFARQWYYDQQDAETQALLDSGELEYPTHLAAATFTDTFNLDDTTSINLNSDGSATFASAEFTNDITINEITVGSGPGADNTNTVFGFTAFKRNISGSGNTACGMTALFSNTEGSDNTAIGDIALYANTTGNRNTAIGRSAGRYAVDDSPAQTFDNCTSLGADTRCSGGNQVQLGDSSTTTYCFGSVQDRSDERDKTDIRDTLLGLDFIKSLRPVDFRWDYRDDYFDKKEVTLKDGTTEEQLVPVTKDGSRARTRFHHGLIAQEVKAAADAQGIDFAGYQDHSVNGGLDVLSIGYTEMIAPLIKAVQELSAENAALKKRLDDAGL